MGLEEDEMSQEKHLLEKEIQNVFAHFIDSTSKRFHLMEQEIEETIMAHARLLRAFKHSEDEVNSILDAPADGTLKSRLHTVKNNYNKFHLKCEKQILAFTSIQKQMESLFDQLGVKDRGDFAEVGDDDFSNERLEKFQKKLQEMKQEVKSRREVFKQKSSNVNELLTQLGEPMPADILSIFDSNNITDASFKTINNFVRDLEREKEKRISEMSEIANEITRLWDLLQIQNDERQKFLQSHSTLSHAEIESCNRELVHLRTLRNRRLPELIEIQKQQIVGILDYLQSEEPIPVYDEADPERAFKFYEEELSKLEAEKKLMSPYIDLINQREEFMAELEDLQKSAAEVAKSQGKKPINMKKQNKDEQSRRRIKSLLPRLEKKLLLLLIEYKEENGQDLIWKGENYIQNLQHIILSDVEINRAKKGQRKKSMQPKKDAHIIMGEKPGVVRRFSENNRMLVNLK
ncbi:hypothetical protein TRFO_29502 [Tritrichomonas foetus]|uniref:Uncharacterized protein n=1 Tax=Tritrichomonas foetus TaxID=1144522 RepID=A0A1J4JWZ7_9EUKA|nr:hypothetical protein TRFO_29502 [Tritrichomonas foetus]|eukprot:OHT03194.1 hypothetical protein TRFO_29502 [Tritrichomonas foetus]